MTRTLDEAIALSERMAPEHVVCDTDAVAARLTRAGTVFVGDYSAQACGDYVTGSNHVLPTSGAAAAAAGLSAADFVRVSTVQRITAAGLRRIAPAGVALAGPKASRRMPRRCDPRPSNRRPHGVRRNRSRSMSYEYERVVDSRTTRCGCTSTRTRPAARQE